MAYQKQTWRNLPDRTTPITAERLGHLETQYDEAISTVNPEGITQKFNSVDATLSKKADLVGGKVPPSQLGDFEGLGGPGGESFPITWNIDELKAPVGSRLTVPTHVSPAGGQLTHPSVVFFPEPWNGFQYWMAMTPYPGGNDAHEDPNIVASMDGINWVVPNGLTNPLDDAPGSPRYNSDTDLVFAQGKLWCFWRYLDTGAGDASENLYVRTSEDGVTWTPKQLVYRSNQNTRRLVSPTFIYEEGVWTMWAVDIAQTPNRLVRLTSADGTPLQGTWSNPQNCTLTMPSGRDPWHVEIRRVGDRLYGIMNDCISGQSGAQGNLYMIESRNGLTWTRGSGVLVPQSQSGEHDALYRSTFVPEFVNGKLGLRIWYPGWTTGSTKVWNLYRTFAEVPTDGGGGGGPLVQGEMFEETRSVPANTGFISVSRNFPRPFSNTPSVTVSTDSGRLNPAVTAVTSTSVTFGLNNWTSAAVGNVQNIKIRYVAVGNP